MSNIPPADFSAILPQGPRDGEGEPTDPTHAREPIPHQPLVTQIPAYDPAKSLADQIAEVLNEPPAQRDEDHATITPTQLPSQEPDALDTPPATPSPEQVTPPTSPQSPPQGEGEGGSDAVSGSSAAPPDPSLDPDNLTHDQQVSLDKLAENLYGRPPSRDESIAIMQLWEDMARLSPEQKTQVARAMGYIPDDNPPTSRPAPAPSNNTPEPEDEQDPYLAPHLQPLQQDLQEIRGQVQSLVSERQQTETERMQKEVDTALSTFRDQYAELTPEEHAALQMRIRQNGIVAANYNQTGDIASSVTSALEYEMYRDENLRAKVLTSRQQQEQQQDVEQQKRQHKAASLSPGGAQVSRDDTPTPPRVMDRTDARKAMVEELKPLFSQQ